MTEVTRILSRIESGDPTAARQLLPLVYEELRKLAAAHLAREKPGQTLQATALVHEAFIRLVDGDEAKRWDSRGHFFAAAAEAMRRILVSNARRKHATKHGGKRDRIEIDLELLPAITHDDKLMALDEALQRLEVLDKRKAELVKLRYFVGLSIGESAQLLGISTATADRDWKYARAWLQEQMTATNE